MGFKSIFYQNNALTKGVVKLCASFRQIRAQTNLSTENREGKVSFALYGNGPQRLVFNN